MKKFFPRSFSTKRLSKMPPKKIQSVEKPLLGRPGNNLKMGIVGLPNVGKSSFFNSITNSAMPSEVPNDLPRIFLFAPSIQQSHELQCLMIDSIG
jgi:GTP-binding protein EngB required for normal cell division